MSELNKYLRVARKGTDITQLQLAKKLGFASPQFVSNWERGICKVPTNTLAKLITILKLDPDCVIELRMRDNRAILMRALGKRR